MFWWNLQSDDELGVLEIRDVLDLVLLDCGMWVWVDAQTGAFLRVAEVGCT